MTPLFITATVSAIVSGFFLVVGDVDERQTDLGLDPLELHLHLPTQLEVERTERLVEQQHRRPVDDGGPTPPAAADHRTS